jgi:hypothetical protein
VQGLDGLGVGSVVVAAGLAGGPVGEHGSASGREEPLAGEADGW